MIRVNAYGSPVPKGSKKLITHGKGGRKLPVPLLLDDKPHELDTWEKSVAGAALVAIGAHPRPVFGKQVAVGVTVAFRLARPPSVDRDLPTVKPDIDKLARAALDALTGLLWVDDSQVVRLTVSKDYCARGESPGAVIEIETKETQQTLPINGGK